MRAPRFANPDWNPVADPNAVVTRGKARFTVLTPALIRLEWADDGRFEDRATLGVVNRALPVPSFQVETTPRGLVLQTEHLTLRYTGKGAGFTRENLTIASNAAPRGRLGAFTWRPGDEPAGNLGGTVRTLDGVDEPCPLEPGILSRDGWAVVDETDRPVLTGGDEPWVAAAQHLEQQSSAAPAAKRARRCDWYFFGHGRDYRAALRDFTLVAGRIPLPPRYVLGLWWSRYWAYTDAELKDLVAEFERNEFPLDVLVIDMDWHLDGWTGYTWNPACFPDPEGFLKWAHQKQLRVTLNLHPADGVGAHEAAFGEMCRSLDRSPRTEQRIDFDCTDPRFMRAYFEHLHHPLEKQGVDFWWMDWQQGERTRIANLDPLWWLNQLHWEDMERRADQTGRRPLIFSRWGGIGNHRYPIGFSGDTFCTWRHLAFQPRFTATASNVGYAWWSHDIGGHQPGPISAEMFTRWVQWGALSPILRTHTAKNPAAERRMWAYDDPEARRAMLSAVRLRCALAPYLYTAARAAFDTGVGMCRPMYYEHPGLDQAYEAHGQYMLGDDLLAAPVAQPGDDTGRCAAARVWLPRGTWIDWFTWRAHSVNERTGRWIERVCPLDEVPLFARAGAVVTLDPLAPERRRVGDQPPQTIRVRVMPGASGAARHYDDDGLSNRYTTDGCAFTPIEHRETPGRTEVKVGAAEGGLAHSLGARTWEFEFAPGLSARHVRVNGQIVKPGSVRAGTDPWAQIDENGGLRVGVPEHAPNTPLSVAVDWAAEREPVGMARSAIEAAALALGESPSRCARAAAEDPWGLIARVARLGSPRGARDRALCALAGLTCRVELEPSGAGRGKVRARAVLSPGVEGLAGCAVEVHVDGHDQEKARARRRVDAASPAAVVIGATHFSTGLRAQAERVVALPPGAGPVRASASVTLRHAGEAVSIGFARRFLPSINAWRVAGPFRCPYEQQLDRALGPERAPEFPQRIDASATFRTLGGARTGWRDAVRTLRAGDDPESEHFVDLNRLFGGLVEHAAAYAYTRLHADRAGEAVLALGSDDGVIVWLNGQRVYRYDGCRGYGSRQDRVPVSLHKGENLLVLKIGQAAQGWGFGAHLEDEGGAAVDWARATVE